MQEMELNGWGNQDGWIFRRDRADYFEERSDRRAIPVGIGEGSRISGAIIDKNARIGKDVVIEGSKRLPDGDGEGFAVRDGIVIVLKNAVIPPETHIG